MQDPYKTEEGGHVDLKIHHQKLLNLWRKRDSFGFTGTKPSLVPNGINKTKKLDKYNIP